MMMRATQWMAMAVGICLAVSGGATAGNVANFDDLALGAKSYWNGSADSAAGGFSSGTAWFNNSYSIDYASWGGWSYSNMTDTTTPGYGNQYSAIAGTGQSGTNYGMAYVDTYTPTTPSLTLPHAMTLDRAYFTNTTYAYLSMLDGDDYAKEFGGADGSDPDWFLLTITGQDDQGHATGTVVFYLADFRFADNSRDYILNTWTPVDLSGLGAVKSLLFTLTSSDSGDWGMNTPAYFAMDTLTPEPATLCLLAGGVGAVLLRRRSRYGGS
jgi:hypothetical protein